MKNPVLVKTGTGVALLSLAAASQAAIDTSAAVSSITGDAVAAVTAIGVAMLTMAGVLVAFRWARKAMFG